MTKEQAKQIVKEIIYQFISDYGDEEIELTKEDRLLLKVNKTICNAIDSLEELSSDDCVSRKAVLDLMQLKMGGKELYKAVYDLPPVTPTQSWIPVSERLPEDRNIVLVTAYWHETYQVMMASYFGEGLWWCVPFNNCGDHMQKLNPKAWMPLPKPYEEKRGSENGKVC